MLDYVRQYHQKTQITLINLVKSENENIYREQLAEYAKTIRNLTVHTFYGRTAYPDGVLNILQSLAEQKPRTYVCGPRGMMETTLQHLSNSGIDEIVVEEWANIAFDLHVKQQ